MIELVKFKIKSETPIHIGADTVSTIRMPYMIHIAQERKNFKIDVEMLKEFIKILSSFYRNAELETYGFRSFGDIFRDRVYASLMVDSVSGFFTALKKRVQVRSDNFFQYITKFAFSLSRDENIALINWARQNIDIFVSSAVFMVESQKFKDEFEINPDICEIDMDITVPVIPGNSIRGKARRVLMDFVFRTIFGENPHDKLPAKLYYLFFNGGMLTKADGYLNIEDKRVIREKLPFLSILGSMLGKEDLPGKMNINFGILDCLETGKNKKTAMSYLKEYFSTRKNDFEGIISEDEVKSMSSSVQMIYSFLAIEKGATFDWSISKLYMSQLESNFFDLMIYLLNKNGKIGGMSRSGMGGITIEPLGEYKLNYQPAIDYLNKNKVDISNFILEVMNAEDKPKSKKKNK